MQNRPIQLSNVIFNPATQCFEAVAHVHDGHRSRSYACAIAAPITLSFEDAARGLADQALQRHATTPGLSSHFAPLTAQRRATRSGPVRPVDQVVRERAAELTAA